ncbi:VOC family protein [Paenibacillus albus]|uniref:VOC family protein n=1 Tax=Paenibacillus albus TaxID=2495582 RepID=A0A3S8ZZZ7_9BACL|nr:VOC family protein [Paenibacillus albus]AZN39058.1 VOC family protein [Paenibacillus albus]
MGSLTPYIQSEDARAHAAFYVEAFGGEILSVMTHEQLMGAQHKFKDKVMHLSMVVAGGNSIFMSDRMEALEYGTAITLSMSYSTEAEANEVFGKLSAGGNVRYPIAMQPFGIYYGELVDRFGVTWSITVESQTTK